jgi:hypothetical protein
MVIIRTRADDMSIQAVSPESILGAAANAAPGTSEIAPASANVHFFKARLSLQGTPRPHHQELCRFRAAP